MISLPYIIAGVIGLSGLILLLISVIDWLSLRKTHHQPLPHTQSLAAKELTQAQHKAEKIVADAVSQAEATIHEASAFKSDVQQDLETALSQTAQQTITQFSTESKAFEEKFGHMFQSLQHQYEQKTQETLSSIQEIVTKELEDFRDIIKRETFSSQQIISTKIQDEFTAVQKEIMAYRENRYKEVDQTIENIIKKITTDALGKSLTDSDHEALIIQSLEKAKQGGMFTS